MTIMNNNIQSHDINSMPGILRKMILSSMAKALEEMGFGKGKDAINRWRLSERKVLESICNAHGIEISEPKKSRGYSFTVEEYGEYKDTIKQLEAETEKVTADLEKTQAKFDAIKDK